MIADARTAGLPDRLKADLVIVGLIGLATLAAQTLGQTLGEHANQGIGKVEWVHAHVEQAHD